MDETTQENFQRLRGLAERLLNEPDKKNKGSDWNDIEELIHEIQVQRVELQIQKEELETSQIRLLESENELKDLFDNAPVGYLVLNKEMFIQQVNITAAQMLNVTRHKLIGKKLSEFVHKDDRDSLWKYGRSLLRERDAGSLTLFLEPPQRNPVYVQIESVVIGQMDRIRMSLTDITRRHEAETRVRRLRELDNAILRLQSADEVIRKAMRQLLEISGCTRACIALFEGDETRVYTMDRGWEIEHQRISSDAFKFAQNLEPDESVSLTKKADLKAAGLPKAQYLFVPLHRDNGLDGIIGLAEESCLPDDKMLSAAQEVAVQVGIAVYQASLFTRVQQHADELETLVEERTQDLRHSEARFRLLAENMQDIVTLHDKNAQCEYISPSIKRQLGWSTEQIQQDGILSLVHPEDKKSVDNDITQLLQGRHRCRLRHKNSNADGEDTYFWFETIGQKLKGENNTFVNTFRNIHDQVLAEDARQEQQAFTRALLQVTRKIAGSLVLEDVLDSILLALSDVLPYDGANIMLLDADGNSAHVSYLHGYHDPRLEEWMRNHTFSLVSNSSRQMLRTREPFVVPDVREVDDWIRHPQTEKLLSYVGVPIVTDAGVIGFLNVDSYTANTYTKDDADRLKSFAQQAGVAIRNARLHEKEQKLVVAEERNRIARELHDAVSQNLFAAASFAEALPGLTKNKKLAERLKDLHLTIVTAQSEMRTLLFELRPERIAQLSITTLLMQLTENLQIKSNMQVELDVEIPHPLPLNTKILLFRVAQEALVNISKHALAHTVDMILTRENGDIKMSINDDGVGFDPSQDYVGHYGLQSMQERAIASGAHLSINSNPKIGTSITLILPENRLNPKDQHANI